MNSEHSNNSELPEYNSNPFTLSFKGFGLFIDHAKNILIIMILIGCIGLLFNLLSYIPNNSSNYEPRTVTYNTTSQSTNAAEPASAGTIFAIILGVIGVMVFISAILFLISAVYKGFVAAGTVSAVNKKDISAGEAFSQMGSRLGVLFVAEVNTTFRIIGGYILFIIPGIRAQLRYMSTPYIIMSNRDMDAYQAIKTSKFLYKKHLMEAFGIATVGAIIPFIGQAITASGMAMSVKQLTAYKSAGKETPKTHWLNYIGLILFALLFFFFMSIVLLLVAIYSKSS